MVMGLKPKIRFDSSMFPLSLTGCFYWIFGWILAKKEHARREKFQGPKTKMDMNNGMNSLTYCYSENTSFLFYCQSYCPHDTVKPF
jgi:hypothetical protein